MSQKYFYLRSNRHPVGCMAFRLSTVDDYGMQVGLSILHPEGFHAKNRKREGFLRKDLVAWAINRSETFKAEDVMCMWFWFGGHNGRPVSLTWDDILGSNRWPPFILERMHDLSHENREICDSLIKDILLESNKICSTEPQ